jgi:tripartite ATP-independent transporter DctM subunit
MSATAWILSLGFLGLAALGVPFAFALALTIIAVLTLTGISPALLPQTAILGSQSFSLLGIPFFILAGEIMTAGGLSKRLIAVADVFVRHLPGGLGLVTILAACVFAAISGSAPATTAAIGSIMYPAMVARGYSKPYAASLVVSAGVLAPLIPPSIAFIIWGVIAETSIAKLFLSGVLPGLTMAAGLAAYAVWKSTRAGAQRLPRARWTEITAALRDGIWAMLAPVIILGGIYSGLFTPTEASAVACLYGLLVGLVIQRELRIKDLPAVVMRSMRVTALVMAVVIFSNGFGILVAQEQLADKFASSLTGALQEKWAVLLALNLGFFALASVMDEVAIMVIFGPMLKAIAAQLGLDPIHFGAMIVTNVAIGMAAPPVGYCLFVGMAISNVPFAALARAIIPQVLIMLVVLMLVTYVPAFSLALVR